jgi:hypothetical protein
MAEKNGDPFFSDDAIKSATQANYLCTPQL